MSGEIKMNSGATQAAASSFRGLVDIVRDGINKIDSAQSTFGSCWEGQAAQQANETLTKSDESFNTISSNIKVHITHITDAGYTFTTADSVAAANTAK